MFLSFWIHTNPIGLYIYDLTNGLWYITPDGAPNRKGTINSEFSAASVKYRAYHFIHLNGK